MVIKPHNFSFHQKGSLLAGRNRAEHDWIVLRLRRRAHQTWPLSPDSGRTPGADGLAKSVPRMLAEKEQT